MRRREFLALLTASPLAAAESWEKTPFPNWSPDLVERVLTDSPWARPLTVPFEYRPPDRRMVSEYSQIGLPGGIGFPRRGGSGAPGGPAPSVRTEVYLTVRWSSALPVRQALALSQWGRAGLEDPKAVELLTRVEQDYVIEVFGLPVTMAPQGAAKVQEELLKTAVLWWKGGPTIRATEVKVPEHGMHLSAEIRFPRSEKLAADIGTLEFLAKAGPIRIEPKFKPKSMVYRGQLEL
jgi:hypothetical protein